MRPKGPEKVSLPSADAKFETDARRAFMPLRRIPTSPLSNINLTLFPLTRLKLPYLGPWRRITSDQWRRASAKANCCVSLGLIKNLDYYLHIFLDGNNLSFF